MYRHYNKASQQVNNKNKKPQNKTNRSYIFQFSSVVEKKSVYGGLRVSVKHWKGKGALEC